jgi:hypothetical protein
MSNFVPGTNVPAPNTPIESPVSIEQELEAVIPATEVPEAKTESNSAPNESKESKKVEAIQDKKDSGVKITKAEEKQLKEYKLKVNGKEKSFKIDLSNEAELQKHFQKAAASDEAFNQAAEVRKAALAFMEDLKKNPRKVLQDPNIGVDLHKFAEEIMNERIQEMEKSPEQRDREAKEKELIELKRQIDEQKKQFESKEQERLQAEHARNLESEISAALDIGGLPKTARTVATMAEMMGIALKYGVDLTPQEIAPIVKKIRGDEFQDVVDSLSDDQLEDFIGKKVIGRLRKKNVAKAKAPETTSSVKATGSEVKKTEEKKEPAKKMTYRDFFKR